MILVLGEDDGSYCPLSGLVFENRQFIKDSMDKKFGSPWHCVARRGSPSRSHETKNILYVFVAGGTGV